MISRVFLAGAVVLAATIGSALDRASVQDATAQAASGPAAYYSPHWNPERIFYLHHSWGNTVPNAIHPPHNGLYCVHPDYRPGQVLSITANGISTTCLIFDMVQTHHQAQWRAKWSLEVSWNTFHSLNLHVNNWVTVHGATNTGGGSGSMQEPGTATQSTQSDRAQYRYFEVTGYMIGNGFLRHWEDYGGLGVFGYPLSDEFEDDNGMTIQVFERAVFEYHPDNPPQFQVLQRRLGAEYWDDPSLDHDIDSLFIDYWHKHGGLMIFGYPISGLIEADGLRYQVFERAVFEHHPTGQILLRRLGAELYA